MPFPSVKEPNDIRVNGCVPEKLVKPVKPEGVDPDFDLRAAVDKVVRTKGDTQRVLESEGR